MGGLPLPSSCSSEALSHPSPSLPTKLKRKHRTADISGIEIVRREFYASATAAVLSGLHLHG